MLKKHISPWLGILILALLLVIASYLIYKSMLGTLIPFNPKQEINFSKKLININVDSNIKEVGEFVVNYLDAYKNVGTKRNYAEILEFISDSAIAQMQRESMPFDTNYTDFDNYEIISIEKANHEEFAPLISGYVAQVKLFLKGEVLKDAAGGEIVKISVIKEDNQWRTPSWYFRQ